MTEFSVIKRSEIEGALRLDAEYYCSPTLLKGRNFYRGEDVVSLVQYGTSKELNEEERGFPVLRLNEFEESFVGYPAKHCDKISESEFESLRLKRGDVLICRTNGNPQLVGRAALVMKDTSIGFASYLFRVKTDIKRINPSALVAFLNSRFGRSEIEKYLMPSIQSNFSPAKFREIKIPIFPDSIQEKIAALTEGAYQSLKESQKSYFQAENLLLKELELKDFNIEDNLSCVVNLFDTKSAHRVDAEYFQPKYERLIERIIEKGGGALTDVADVVAGKFDPHTDPQRDFKYVALADVDSTIGIISNFTELLGKEAPSRARRVLKSGDVIVSSVAGSLGKVALVDKKHDGHVASTGFFQFRPRKILPGALLVLAKSKILQMQLERSAAGTILSAVPKQAIDSVVVPILSQDVQKKVADLVCKSHEARKKSKQLLEEAKRKVEEAIETKNSR